jgi:hypothetical protein
MFMTIAYYRRGSWKTKYVVKRDTA